MIDPIVDEVRKYRKEHTKKFHGDLSEICADLHRVQENSGHKIVRLAPKKVEPIGRSGEQKLS